MRDRRGVGPFHALEIVFGCGLRLLQADLDSSKLMHSPMGVLEKDTLCVLSEMTCYTAKTVVATFIPQYILQLHAVW